MDFIYQSDFIAFAILGVCLFFIVLPEKTVASDLSKNH